MRLGIVLVLCVILISIGLGLRQSGIRQQEAASATISGNLLIHDENKYSSGVAQESWGIGFLACGGGFFIIWVVAMILDRKPKDKQ
jgi:hypothetical protein